MAEVMNVGVMNVGQSRITTQYISFGSIWRRSWLGISIISFGEVLGVFWGSIWGGLGWKGGRCVSGPLLHLRPPLPRSALPPD